MITVINLLQKSINLLPAATAIPCNGQQANNTISININDFMYTASSTLIFDE
jgi:hypothetical protein